MADSVLVVGATGSLGGLVVRALLGKGKSVRALVREGSDASTLESLGVSISRGDMLDTPSLDRALDGVSSLVTTAIGYSHRKPGDSLARVDDLGNRNLVDAAQRAGIKRFVFTSILTCDIARNVPHFWAKKLIEDYLEASGVPFVALRPGAFLSANWWASGLKRGVLQSFGRSDVKWTYILPEDVARCLADAVDNPGAVGRRIDLGMDRPLSVQDAAALCGRFLGRPVTVRSMPAGLIFGLGGIFNARMRDFGAMFKYFLTGKYVADTSAQRAIFGSVPAAEDSMRKALAAAGLIPKQ